MKRVILNSGGLDSLALAMILHAAGDELYSFHIHQGVASSDSQMASAQRIADKFCVSHKVVEIHGLLQSPDSTGGPRPIACQTVLLAMLGQAYANLMNVVSVVSGNRYERVTVEFEKHFNRSLKCVAKGNERVYSRPLGAIYESDVWDIIKDEPLAPQTVSCLAEPPCGTCFKCVERTKVGLSP
jgi:7-cyano-7-deazaguanine synthase in queuosine biosynthesis